MWGCVRLGLLLALAGLVLVGSSETGASVGATIRVSVDSASVQGDGASHEAAPSADGRYVAFQSAASNLVPDDTNGRDDIFIRDLQTGTTQRVSVSSGGVEGNSDSLHPAVSDDGRYVAFDSNASNLVSGDTNGWVDAFVRDRQTNSTERVSVSSAEVQANNTSWYPAVSGDGRYVAFQSFASNLVSGDTNNVEDVFVRDRQAGTTTRVSRATSGTQGNNASGGWLSISGDGRYVAFTSDATNLVAGDTNGYGDIFVRDRDTDGDGTFDESGAVSTTRVSVDSAGAQSNGESYYAAISADGRFVAFGSPATNLVAGDTNGYSDVFVRDRQAGATTRVSLDSAGAQGNAGSFDPAISSDGHHVAFESFATNLVAIDTNAVEDVFVRDLQAGTTERVSTDSGSAQGNGASTVPAVSADGRFVAFESLASNLVPGDTNTFCDTDGDTEADDNCPDIFLHDQFDSVGGIAELPDVSRPSTSNHTALAALAAAALALLAAGTWYAGKRLRPG